MSGWFVYIVRCADNSLYTGVTTDIERRLDEHNSDRKKAAAYTRSRRPVSLVYSENCPNRSSACQREATIKRMTKLEKEQLISSKTDK